LFPQAPEDRVGLGGGAGGEVVAVGDADHEGDEVLALLRGHAVGVGEHGGPVGDVEGGEGWRAVPGVAQRCPPPQRVGDVVEPGGRLGQVEVDERGGQPVAEDHVAGAVIAVADQL